MRAKVASISLCSLQGAYGISQHLPNQQGHDACRGGRQAQVSAPEIRRLLNRSLEHWQLSPKPSQVGAPRPNGGDLGVYHVQFLPGGSE